ncbi:MAG: DnaA/Hda family protein [Micavibrio sp.]|nr:DnaA/Hda family protein [Micavibrio sp.]
MKPTQLGLDLGHREAFEREDLWVSVSNAAAIGWLDRWPDWNSPLLVIHGPAASGKTHLAKVWQKKAAALDILPEKLAELRGINDLPKAAIVDDAAIFIGDRHGETALFHFYNRMKESGGHILMTALNAPKEWDVALPDLKSRLLAAPAVAIAAPDEELMAVVLTKLFSDRQIFVPQEVVQFILPRVERSFSALRDLAAEIDRKALAEKRPVTIPLVREILQSQGSLL